MLVKRRELNLFPFYIVGGADWEPFSKSSTQSLFHFDTNKGFIFSADEKRKIQTRQPSSTKV